MLSKKFLHRLDREINSLSFVCKESRQRHFTLAFDKKKLVAVGYNYKDETHPLAKKFGFYDARIHSELDCLSKVFSRRIVPAKLIYLNLRLNRSGSLMLAKPCPKCSDLLEAFGVKDIYYFDGKDFVKLCT